MGRLAVLAIVGLVSSACGGGAGGASGPPSTCAGSILTGDQTGNFGCYAVADSYTKGVYAPNSLVQVLNSESEKTQIRPAGVKDLGIQVELAGEALAGIYSDHSMPATKAYLDLDDGRSFNKIVEMTLTLEETKFDHQESSVSTITRVFEIHGSVSFTVADDAGSQVSVSASF